MELGALREHPVTANLPDGQLSRLAACAREVEFAEDAFIFREGNPADAIYLLRSGCVVLEQHIPGRGVVRVESLCAGDILGLSWLFPEARWALDARCPEPVRAFSLDAACVHEVMRDDPDLALKVMTHIVQALYQRLMRVRLQRLDVYRAGA